MNETSSVMMVAGVVRGRVDEWEGRASGEKEGGAMVASFWLAYTPLSFGWLVSWLVAPGVW